MLSQREKTSADKIFNDHPPPPFHLPKRNVVNIITGINFESYALEFSAFVQFSVEKETIQKNTVDRWTVDRENKGTVICWNFPRRLFVETNYSRNLFLRISFLTVHRLNQRSIKKSAILGELRCDVWKRRNNDKSRKRVTLGNRYTSTWLLSILDDLRKRKRETEIEGYSYVLKLSFRAFPSGTRLRHPFPSRDGSDRVFLTQFSGHTVVIIECSPRFIVRCDQVPRSSEGIKKKRKKRR